MSEPETSQKLSVKEVLELVSTLEKDEAIEFIKDDTRQTVVKLYEELTAVEKNPEEDRRDRFIRVVEKRANFVIDKLANLGKVTQNPQNYLFDAEQIELIFGQIETFTEDIKKRFMDCISISDTKEDYKIRL